MISTPKFVVFDFDGVLVDTVRAWFSVVVDALQQHGVNTTIDEILPDHRGRILADSVAIFERDYKIKLPENWSEALVDRAAKEVERRFTPIPGSVEVVQIIAQKNLPIAVASGSLRSVLSTGLHRLGIAEIVDGRFVSSHDDGKHKPLPDVYIRACALLGFPPNAGVAIEDSPSGIESARNAGMTVVGFAADIDPNALLDAGAQAVFTKMTDLPGLLSL